jgi:alpha-L-fucosidase
MRNQLHELLTSYGQIDLLWIDQYSNPYTGSHWREIKDFVHETSEKCIVIANNSLNFEDTDILGYEHPWLLQNHPERALPPETNTDACEVNDTLMTNGTWFWKKEDSPSTIKSPENIASMVKLCNSRHGNFLLNCPPDARGLFPDYYLECLEKVGKLIG